MAILGTVLPLPPLRACYCYLLVYLFSDCLDYFSEVISLPWCAAFSAVPWLCPQSPGDDSGLGMAFFLSFPEHTQLLSSIHCSSVFNYTLGA